MSDKGPGRREGLAIAAINPVDGKSCEIFISHERLKALPKRGRGAIFECRDIVPHVLQHPSAIFEGLRRDEDEDKWGYGWRCYCGSPTMAYREDGTQINPYPGQVFLVFLNEDRTAYNWRWEHADPDNPRLPRDHATRFTRRLL